MLIVPSVPLIQREAWLSDDVPVPSTVSKYFGVSTRQHPTVVRMPQASVLDKISLAVLPFPRHEHYFASFIHGDERRRLRGNRKQQR